MLTKTEPAWLIPILSKLAEKGEILPPSSWQSQDVADKDHMSPVELTHETLQWTISDDPVRVVNQFGPNLPWAEDHFKERVGGEPLNPPPSEAWWPFNRNRNVEHKHGEIFSHTYPERFWPRFAGAESRLDDELILRGIRYDYGDLLDVVKLLERDPLTRQAYLPIWFPEDTGAVEGQRVPCTLGYHFMIRNNRATVVYYMRSCDALRHLKDDAYMAARLLQWVTGKLRENGIDVHAHTLLMHISSLHIFKGDKPLVKLFLENQAEQEDQYGYGV